PGGRARLDAEAAGGGRARHGGGVLPRRRRTGKPGRDGGREVGAMSRPRSMENSNPTHGGARLGAAPGGTEMTPIERLEDWVQFATPREQWRMERDPDGIGVPYAVDKQGRRE